MELIVGGAVHEGWDLVVTVVAVYYAALIVYHDLLKDCLAETHGKCALDLAFACLTVEHAARIVEAAAVDKLDLAGLDIDADFHAPGADGVEQHRVALSVLGIV